MKNVDRFSRYNIKQGFLLQSYFLSPNLISPLERQNLQQSVLKYYKDFVNKKGFEFKRNNYKHSILNVPLECARGRRN